LHKRQTKINPVLLRQHASISPDGIHRPSSKFAKEKGSEEAALFREAIGHKPFICNMLCKSSPFDSARPIKDAPGAASQKPGVTTVYRSCHLAFLRPSATPIYAIDTCIPIEN